MPVCKICEHDENIEVTNGILSGDIRISEAVKVFDCTQEELEEHLKDHIRVLSSDDGVVAIKRKEIDGVGMLSELTGKLNTLANDLLDDYDPESPNARQISAVVREVRGCIKDIALLKGDLQTSIRVELQLQYNFMNGLQNWLMQNICDEDKKKMVAYLETNAE